MSEFDREERDILTTYERDEWRPVAERGAENERYRRYARATFGKDRRVNIHISGNDLEAIQRQADEEWIPYEALMSSVLQLLSPSVFSYPESTEGRP